MHRLAAVSPCEGPVTDLLARPMGLTIRDSALVVRGWGGVRADAPPSTIGSTATYYVRITTPEGQTVRSGAFVCDHAGDTLLRITGRWDPAQVGHFACRHGLKHRSVTSLPDVRARKRRRATGFRTVRTRTRWLWLWCVVLGTELFVTIPVAQAVGLKVDRGGARTFPGMAVLFVLLLFTPRILRAKAGLFR